MQKGKGSPEAPWLHFYTVYPEPQRIKCRYSYHYSGPPPLPPFPPSPLAQSKYMKNFQLDKSPEEEEQGLRLLLSVLPPRAEAREENPQETPTPHPPFSHKYIETLTAFPAV